MNRLDPATKSIWLLCVSLVAIFDKSSLVQMWLALGVLAVALGLARIPPDRFWRSVRYFFIICTSYFLLQALITPGDAVWQWGFFRITWEGLEIATGSALSIFTIIVASLVFVVTTDPKDFAITLHKHLHVPYVIAYMLFVGLRFLPLVEQIMENIKEAQMVRGVGGEGHGLLARIKSVRHYTVPLLATTLQRGRITASAMDSKGFRAFSDRTYLQQVHIGTAGRAAIAISVLLTLLLFVSPFLGWRPATLQRLFG
jgi:energy-coupling factor transport system permease protein